MAAISNAVVSLVEGFSDLISPDAELQRLATGCTWSEGPVYIPGQEMVLWSDIPNNRIMQWADGVSKVHAADVEYTNGHTIAPDGSIYSCSHGNRRIEKRSLDGTVTSVVDSFEGKRLNSPNDLVVKSDGTIWFTDPPYGILSDDEGHKAVSEIGANYVFRFDPDSGSLSVVTELIEEPNGLAFSADETVLYISDTSAALRKDGSGNHHIMKFDVVGECSLENGRVFAEINPGLSDGFRISDTGHVFTSCESGIQVFDEDAQLVGRVDVPEVTSNCVFGGVNGQTLYITASRSLYSIETRTKGVLL